ncbi:MAG: tetratricopeptide repeat protein [Candidatus Shapirobacteria bacterium]|nr:tetratricopeptide repeat protein [Candidatus Shapirobacteria bacterium]MDD4383200.1 tetratricopeptide repeat protein [Candidatus Shapirobacteria bacterium]
MSQKKAKRLRRIETVTLVEKNSIEHVKGIRQILKENWKFLVALCVGVFVLYSNSLNGAFVSDDYASITDNSLVTSFGSQAKNGLVVGLCNWLTAVLFGVKNPMSYHLFCLILYLIICVLGFVFLYLVFSKKTAILSIILFAVLPIHVEAVSWISGKPYLLTSIMVLFELILFILYTRSENKKYFWWFIGLLPLTFLSERVRSISLLLIIPLFVFTFGTNFKLKINWGKVFIFCCLGIIILGIVLWPLISYRINNVNSGYNGYGGIFYDPFFQYPTSIAKYLQLALIPVDLTLYHTMYILPNWLNWMITLTYLSSIIYFFFRDKKFFFALTFIFIATAPSMAPVKVSWLVAERYLLLGSLGFCAFLILFFQRLGKKWEIPSLILFCLVVGFYGVRTYLRNINWQTNHNLWVNTCQVSPNSHNAWNNIGDDYDKLAQMETTDAGKLNQYLNSVKGFTQSVTVKNNYADAYHNRANIFYKIGRYDLAKDSYETALSYGPNLYQSYYSLLQIDLVEKNYNSAINHLNKLNTVRPNDPQVYYAASVVYANMGRVDQAISILEQLVKANPNWNQAVDLLAQLKASQTTKK